MALLNEPIRPSDVLLFESDKFFNYSRDQIVLASGGASCVVGQVLGQITVGAATSAAKAGGNTGAGTLTVDVTTPTLPNAKVGIYTVRVPVVGTFIVTDPRGIIVGDALYGAGATVTFADQIKFAFHDDGSTHFVAGDGFDVTVAAGSGKFVQVTPAANDGSQVAAGVCLEATTTAQGTPTLSADTNSVALTRGPAAVKVNGLTWTSGMTTPQIATALAQLLAIGIKNVADYGA